MVVVGHAFVVTIGGSEHEPAMFFHYRPSYLAVNLFFIASGFLVTKSMLYREDLVEYGAARSLRIYPALIAHVFFIMLIIGPLVTKVPLAQYFTDPQFWTQPFKVLSFVDTDMVLPGTFTPETNHENIGSGALWTLRYEVLAYIGTAAAFGLGLSNIALWSGIRTWRGHIRSARQIIFPCHWYSGARLDRKPVWLPIFGIPRKRANDFRSLPV